MPRVEESPKTPKEFAPKLSIKKWKPSEALENLMASMANDVLRQGGITDVPRTGRSDTEN